MKIFEDEVCVISRNYKNEKLKRQIINLGTHMGFSFPFENQLSQEKIICSIM